MSIPEVWKFYNLHLFPKNTEEIVKKICYKTNDINTYVLRFEIYNAHTFYKIYNSQIIDMVWENYEFKSRIHSFWFTKTCYTSLNRNIENT